MKTSNKELFHSLCKEYNLTIVLQNQYVIHAIIPSKYLVGGFILEYNIIKDSLYMPANIDRDNQHIFLFSVSQFSPMLFKIMCFKYNRLVKELKEIELQQRQARLQSDF
jgi:CTP:phosphocholine cytidylyltransferase-like protein